MNKSATILPAFLLLTFSHVAGQRLNYNKDSLAGRSFSLEQFDKALHSKLKDSSVGWAFCIWQNNKPVYQRHGGYKITPADKTNGKGVPFEVTTRIHIASLSKCVTAIAIAKLVQMKKIEWDAEVKQFLPSWWKFHPSFEHLTVKELLTMKSGLNAPLDQVSSSMDSLRLHLERGPDPSKAGVFNYQNTSYGLLRIIIAYADGFDEFSQNENGKALSVVTANRYKKFVNTHILRPAGVDSADCRIIDEEPAFSYPFPYNNEHGELTGDNDLTEFAGGFGWYMSANDAAKWIDAVIYSDKILSPAIVDQLIDLGFPFILRKRNYGSYFGTGGDWGHPVKPSGWKGIHTYFLCFPENIVVVVFTNSGEGSPSRKMMNAYYESFR